MKVSRRGLLGLFGGAAAAGPKLARGIAETAGIAGGYGTAPAGYGTMSGDAEYRKSRIKQLRHLLSGVDKDRPRERKMNRLYRMEDLERLRLDSLRSVSPGQKMRILIDGMADRDERARIAGAEFELADLLNPLKDL